MIKLLLGAAVGIPEQYFGGATNGNLATATALERPAELTFTKYQEVLVAVLEAIAREVLEALYNTE